MPDRAHVTSTEAIESFRAALINYLGKVRPILEDASDEARRTRDWLQADRRIHWENEVRRRARKVEEAEQAVFSAGLSNLREVSSAERAAVLRAKRALAEAEEKLRLVKRWQAGFDHQAQPLLKELDQLRNLLGQDMPKAAAHLAQVIRKLDVYTGEPAPRRSDATTPADAGQNLNIHPDIPEET